MKLKEIQVGRTYASKVSNVLTAVTILEVSRYGGWIGRNERTGREVRIRSAQRLQFEVSRQENGKWSKLVK